MKIRKFRAILRIAAVAIASLGTATAIEAQMSGSVYGAAEADTKGGNMLFAGTTFGPAGGTVAPIFGVQAYRLYYKSAGSSTTVYALRPSAGLRFGFTGGSANVSLGYSFASKDVAAPVTTVRDQGEGAFVSGGLSLNPSGSPWTWGAMGSYGLKSESFWGRLKATNRIRETPSGSWHIAPMVSFISGRGYNATEPAAMIEWHANQGMSWGAGLGYRLPNSGSNALVFKLEASHSLF